MKKNTFSFRSPYVVYKETKDLRFRLAETEHELVVRIPLAVGWRPKAAQPQTVVVAFQLEDVRVAVRVGEVSDLLHAHVNNSWLSHSHE